MKHLYVLLGLLFALQLTGCKGESETEEDLLDYSYEEDTEEVDETPVEANWESIVKKEYKEDQKLIIEGYIAPLPSTVYMSDNSFDISIYPRRFQNGGFEVSVGLPIGKSANHVYNLPENYTPADFKVVTDKEGIVTAGDKVRIEATVFYIHDDSYSLEDATITKLEDNFDAAVFADAVPLTSEIINEEDKKSVYCYMEGTLSLPTFIYSLDGDISLDFKNQTNEEIKSVDFRVSDGPSSMNDIPDNYAADDLVIRDWEGNEVKPGTTVRVYGVWERYSSESSTGLGGSFKVEEVEVK